ncbi:MAG: hypothetical protein IB618_00220 [Candidatus Pacearchaeota archaeon]|nr:MAG: hypothetical protein IB618_00220 [Candidatus Pacearchaeota archaeon]
MNLGNYEADRIGYLNKCHETAKMLSYRDLRFSAERLDIRDFATRAGSILEERKKLEDLVKEFPELGCSVNDLLAEAEKMCMEKNNYINHAPFEYSILMEVKEENGDSLIEVTLPIFLKSKKRMLQKKLNRALLGVLAKKDTNDIISGDNKNQFVSYIVKSKSNLVYGRALEIAEELKQRLDRHLKKENLILENIYFLNNDSISNSKKTGALEERIQKTERGVEQDSREETDVIKIRGGMTQKEISSILGISQSLLSKVTKEKFKSHLVKGQGYSKKMLDYIIKKAQAGIFTEVEAMQRVGDNFGEIKRQLKKVTYDGTLFYIKKSLRKIKLKSEHKKIKPKDGDIIIESEISKKEFLSLLGYNLNYLSILRTKNKKYMENIPAYEKNLKGATLTFLITHELFGVLTEHDAIEKLDEDFEEFKDKFGGLVYKGQKYYIKKKIRQFKKLKRKFKK